MKLSISIILFVTFLQVNSQEKKVAKYQQKEKSWYIPDYAKVQFAGNIGFLSAGIGYKMINKLLFTELIYGYEPNAISGSNNTIQLLTLKNTFTLFNKDLGNNFSLSPISGITTTLEFGGNSYLTLPDKYPRGYYITNAVHFTVFAGVLCHKNFDNNTVLKGIDFYYEVGTLETYLWFALTTKEVSFGDVFSSAIGVNFYL